MLKSMESNETNSVNELKANLWQSLKLLKGSTEDENTDYYITVLYLLILQQEGILNELNLNSNIEFSSQLHNFISILNAGKSDPKLKIEVLKAIFNIGVARDIYEIRKLLASLDQQLLKSHFAEIFDFIIYKASKSESRLSGTIIQPLELSKFVRAIAELNAGSKIYNPFGGLASFGVFLDNSNNYVGQELNVHTWAKGILRLIAHEKVENSKFLQGDSITGWNPLNEKYDLIVSNPPFNVHLPNEITGRFGIIKTFEQFLIEKGIEDLTPNGKLIAIIPQGFLFRSGSDSQLREYLIENDWLELVITFPGGLFANTNLSTSLIVINKNKKNKGSVKFLDATKFFHQSNTLEKQLDWKALIAFLKEHNNVSATKNSYIENSELLMAKEPSINYGSQHKQIDKLTNSNILATVKNKIIVENEYNLSAPRYFLKNINGINLGKITTLIRGERNFKQIVGKYIRIRDLKETKFNFNLNLDIIDDMELPTKARLINESALLIAGRWNTLKPTYFEYTGEPIYISNEIIALKFDVKEVDKGFLINEMHSEYFIKQVNMVRTGTTVSFIPLNDLLKLKIQLPELPMQVEILNREKEIYILEKQKQVEELKKQIGFTSDIQIQNNFLRHSIAGDLANLRGSYRKLKSIFDNKITKLLPHSSEFKEHVNSELTLLNLFQMMERDIEKISKDTQRNSQVEITLNTTKMEPIEIMSFLENYVIDVKSREDRNFEISFKIAEDEFKDIEGKSTKVFISGNQNLLKDMFNNIIENAVFHAFTSLEEKKNLIHILLMGSLYENPTITISVGNNGKRLPEGFTQEMFIINGSKAGHNSGNGFGGWYIDQIIKKHNGVLFILDEQGPEGVGGDWATSFEIELPILNFESNDIL